MTNMVTRCPQCSTSFRITPTQIQKARGAVRCGSCLHIFKAQEHLVENVTGTLKIKTAAKPKTKKAPSKPAKAPAPQQKTLDIPEPSTPVSTEPEEKPSTPNTTTTKSDDTLNFDQKQIDTESLQNDDFLISDDMDKPPPSNTDIDAEIDDFYLEPTQPASSLFDGKDDQNVVDEFIDSSDESWTEDLLENTQEQELLPEPAEQEKPEEKKKIQKTEVAPQKNTTLAERLANRDNTNVPVFPPPQAKKPAATPARAKPNLSFQLQAADEEDGAHYEPISAYDSERAAMLMNIDPEPLEMIAEDEGGNRKLMLWGGLSLLALLLLVAQIAYFQFDRFNRVQPYRGYYQQLCSVLGCKIPALIDTRKIRAYNLHVRTNPLDKSSLVVDALIINDAPFAQPYPHLALEFSDLNNQPLASRHFSPAEYLHGELRGGKIMRPNQPIHISLELVNPGDDAVNYRIFTP